MEPTLVDCCLDERVLRGVPNVAMMDCSLALPCMSHISGVEGSGSHVSNACKMRAIRFDCRLP